MGKPRTFAHWLLLSVALAAVAAVFALTGPLPQWPEYHHFADGRTMFGVTNAHNVFSNLGLLIVGAWGLIFVLGRQGSAATGQLRAPYLVFFAGLALTGLGSAWYHLAPGNPSLVWDRLPMTVMFMGFFATVLGELIRPGVAKRWLAPLLLAGPATVLWWAGTESAGAGDLRAYGLAQFLPVILIVMMLVLYPAPRHYAGYIVAMMVLFGLAKLSEQFDPQIYRQLGWVGGHALKHLLSALAAAVVLVMLMKRRRIIP